MSAHTPGPWFVACCAEGESCWCRLIVTSPAPTIGVDDYALEDCVIASGAVRANDARLIAAAPDLYAAARMGLTFMEDERRSLLESHCHLDDEGEPILETLDEDVADYIAAVDAHIADCRAALAKVSP